MLLNANYVRIVSAPLATNTAPVSNATATRGPSVTTELFVGYIINTIATEVKE